MFKRRQHGRLCDMSQTDNGVANFLFHALPPYLTKGISRQHRRAGASISINGRQLIVVWCAKPLSL
jgi:hypothetical protein